MKHKLLTLFQLLIAIISHAQSDQADINEQVWKPFTKAIMAQDVSGFVALHSSDLVRAEIYGNKVMGWEEYKKSMEAGWPEWKESIKKNKINYTFELRFIDRISNGTLAYEVGYLKTKPFLPLGKSMKALENFMLPCVKKETHGKSSWTLTAMKRDPLPQTNLRQQKLLNRSIL